MGTREAEELRRVVLQVAGEAAGLLKDYACTEEFTEGVKGETIRADVEAESYIIDALRASGLGGIVVTEESGVVEIGDGDLVFLVDPLDGSKNYQNCIPWSNVSIAVARAGSSLRGVVAGVVHPVFYGQPFSFSRGSGCWIGGVRIAGPRKPPAEFIYVYIESPEAAPVIAKAHEILGKPKVRSLGSAALEMAYTALGRGLAFIDVRGKLRNVDVAAALGITLECGGEVLGAGGAPLDSPVDGVVRVGTVISSHDPAVAARIAGIAGGDTPRDRGG